MAEPLERPGTGQPSKRARERRMRAYLDALKEGAKPLAARQHAAVSRMTISTYRRKYKWFRDEEALHLKVTLKESQQYDYLDLLHYYSGNQLTARKGADVDPDELAQWRKDPKFFKREQEELEYFPAKAEQELTNAAIGRRSKLKDPKLTMEVLKKWKPEQWGDKPRVIEHHHLQGAALDDELARLLAIGAPDEPDTSGD